MVDMGVGQPDLLQRELEPLHLGQDARQVATGVNDGGLQGLVAPDDGAVLLERGYRDGQVVQHGFKLVFCK